MVMFHESANVYTDGGLEYNCNLSKFVPTSHYGVHELFYLWQPGRQKQIRCMPFLLPKLLEKRGYLRVDEKRVISPDN